MKLKSGVEVKPMLSRVFVEMEALFIEQGVIAIPEAYKSALKCVGTVVDFNARKEDVLYTDGKLAIGSRVIMDPYGGRFIEGNIRDYPILTKSRDNKGILALAWGDEQFSTIIPDLPRCKFCGNVRTGVDQGMLMMSGKCPRCLKDRYGVVQPLNPEVTVQDSEVEEFHEIIHGRG